MQPTYDPITINVTEAPPSTTHGRKIPVSGRVVTCWRVPPGAALEVSIDAQGKWLPFAPGDRVTAAGAEPFRELYFRWTQLTAASGAAEAETTAVVISGSESMAFESDGGRDHVAGASVYPLAAPKALTAGPDQISTTSVPCNGCRVEVRDATGLVYVGTAATVADGIGHQLNTDLSGDPDFCDLPVKDLSEVFIFSVAGDGEAVATIEKRG
jgi:hypothetical protein